MFRISLRMYLEKGCDSSASEALLGLTFNLGNVTRSINID